MATRANHRAVAAEALVLVVVPMATVLGASANDAYPPLAIRVICTEVRAAGAGDTCASVAQAAGFAAADDIMFLNPNITCGALFPGQWVCVKGAASG